jgi:hypothetical protein
MANYCRAVTKSLRGTVAKLVARLLATAALWVRILTSLKNTKSATQAKEVPTNCSPPNNIQKIVPYIENSLK